MAYSTAKPLIQQLLVAEYDLTRLRAILMVFGLLLFIVGQRKAWQLGSEGRIKL